MPLQVQKLMEQGYDSDAFALASLLTLLALVTLGLKVWLERKTRRQLMTAAASGIVDSNSETQTTVTRNRSLKSDEHQHQQINKTFGTFRAVDDVSLEIAGGSLVALLGPSGSGKTTLLRIIAGLETPETGTVICHGEDITHRAAADRNVGFVFQHYALFAT